MDRNIWDAVEQWIKKEPMTPQERRTLYNRQDMSTQTETVETTTNINETDDDSMVEGTAVNVGQKVGKEDPMKRRRRILKKLERIVEARRTGSWKRGPKGRMIKL